MRSKKILSLMNSSTKTVCMFQNFINNSQNKPKAPLKLNNVVNLNSFVQKQFQKPISSFKNSIIQNSNTDYKRTLSIGVNRQQSVSSFMNKNKKLTLQQKLTPEQKLTLEQKLTVVQNFETNQNNLNVINLKNNRQSFSKQKLQANRLPIAARTIKIQKDEQLSNKQNLGLSIYKRNPNKVRSVNNSIKLHSQSKQQVLRRSRQRSTKKQKQNENEQQKNKNKSQSNFLKSNLSILSVFDINLSISRIKKSQKIDQASQYSYQNDESITFPSYLHNYVVSSQFHDQSCQVQLDNLKNFDSVMMIKNTFSKKINQYQDFLQNFIQIKSVRTILQQKHQLLSKEDNISPENQRQQKIRAFSKDLQKAEKQVHTNFKKFIQKKKQKQNCLLLNKVQYSKQINLITQALQTQIKVINKRFINKGDDKFVRITKRLSKCIQNFTQITWSIMSSWEKLASLTQPIVKQLSVNFQNWTSLLYENRFLIYNCFNEIKKLPQITSIMFGFHKEKIDEDQDIIKSQEDRFKQYLSSKCNECYARNVQLKIFKHKNKSIISVIRSLQCLLRDSSKVSQF